MHNDLRTSAALMENRGKELFTAGQFALAAACYARAFDLFTELRDQPNSLQTERSLQECLDLARQHGQDYEKVKEVAPEILLDPTRMLEALPDFNVNSILDHARRLWEQEDYYNLLETVRECQQLLPALPREEARTVRGYLDFYTGAAYVGIGRGRDGLPSLRAAYRTMRELLDVYGEVYCAMCLLYLGQATGSTERDQAERSLWEARDAFHALSDQRRRAGQPERDITYYLAITLQELARLKADMAADGDAGAPAELLQNTQEAVGYLRQLRDSEPDEDTRQRYAKRITLTLLLLEKTVDRIGAGDKDTLAALADLCTAAVTGASEGSELTDALAKTAVSAYLRAKAEPRAVTVARKGVALAQDEKLRAWLEGVANEIEHRRGLEQEFAAGQQAIAAADFATAYAALTRADEHALRLGDTKAHQQIERLLTETRLRDPELTQDFLEEIRALLRDGNFEEAEKQTSKLRAAQPANPVLAEFRDEIYTAKETRVIEYANAMLAALDANDLAAAEAAQKRGQLLARQLTSEPAALYQARIRLTEGYLRQRLDQAAEAVQTGNFLGADELLQEARNLAVGFPELERELDLRESQIAADRMAIKDKERAFIIELINTGQYAEANVTLSEAIRLGILEEIPAEYQELLNQYQLSRKRLLEARTLAGEGRVREADTAYRDVLDDPIAASFRAEAQAEYDLVCSEWAKREADEAAELVAKLKAAMGKAIDLKSAMTALEGLKALMPGSYDEKVVGPLRHRAELLHKMAVRHYIHGGRFTLQANIIMAVSVLAALGSAFLWAKLGWPLPAVILSAASLLAIAVGANLGGVAGEARAYTAQFHVLSLTLPGIAAALSVIGLSFIKLPWAWLLALALLILGFAGTEFTLRQSTPIRVPELPKSAPPAKAEANREKEEEKKPN